MIKLRQLPDTTPRTTDYAVAPTAAQVYGYLDCLRLGDPGVSIDTEGGPNGVWSIQISICPGTARMIMADNKDAIRAFNAYLTVHNPLCIIHSALYDIPELAKLNIYPQRIHDTMTMAYLLQDEPLGLKPLAWRHANVKMQSYVETISAARKTKALDFLESVTLYGQWPVPDPVLVTEKGVPRVKQPQGIEKKAKRILGDVAKGKVTKDGPIDPRKRWQAIKMDEGRGMVEEVLGPMPDGYLCDIPLDAAVEYACCDADMTLTIYPYLMERLATLDMGHLVDVESGVTQFVNRMHQFGLPCDAGHFAQMSIELERNMERLEVAMFKLVGPFQLSSHQQLSSLLYDVDKLNLSRYLPKKLGKKAGKTKTGDDILAQIEKHHPVIPLVRKWRKLEKLNNTYAKGVPRHNKSDGRVHAEFRTTNTDTGRLSCANPNLMAQPKRDKDWAKKMRNGFYALPGCVILSMDYSQIELRLTAEEANEKSMIRAFLEGIDLHALTASEMFNTPIDKVDKLTQRLPAKTINFGIIYGLTAAGLYRNMVTIKGCEHWTIGLAQKYINQYYDSRPGIRNYIRDTISMAKRYGRVWDWSGRIRRIPGARLQSEYHRAEAERQACNARIQMGAQSIIKQAMADLDPYYEEWRDMGYTDLSPLIQIHDDIVSMVPEDLVDVLVPIQKHIMESVHPLKAGVKVDVEWGRRWGDMYDWEEGATL